MALSPTPHPLPLSPYPLLYPYFCSGTLASQTFSTRSRRLCLVSLASKETSRLSTSPARLSMDASSSSSSRLRCIALCSGSGRLWLSITRCSLRPQPCLFRLPLPSLRSSLAVCNPLLATRTPSFPNTRHAGRATCGASRLCLWCFWSCSCRCR